VPSGGVLGTGATDFFCDAVATGSRGLVQLLRSPSWTLLALGAVLAFAVFGGSRTTWQPSAPLRLGRRRSWGQVLTSSARMYVQRAPLFLSIGVLFIPLGLVISVLESLLLGGFGLLGVDTTGASAGALALLLIAVGAVLTLLGVALVQAVTASALVQIDAGQTIGLIHAYRLALGKFRPLLGGLALAVAVCVVLSATWLLIPVAIWLAVRWALFVPVVEIEGRSGVHALRRSGELVEGRWLRVASLVGLGAVLALGAGPFLGALLILLTDAPLPLLNVVAGVVYALVIPFVSLVTAYVYFDARARSELEPRKAAKELPAEIEVSYEGTSG
jgi:hypothetical protein